MASPALSLDFDSTPGHMGDSDVLQPQAHPHSTPPPSVSYTSDSIVDQGMLFIDTISKEFDLGPVHVSHLRAMYQLGTNFEGNLSKADLYTRIFALACQFSTERRITLAVQAVTADSVNGTGGDLKRILDELSIRLDANFSLTSDQTLTVRRTCQEFIYQPRRISFKNLYSEVDKHVRQNAAGYQMAYIFSVPARESKWMSEVKRIASSVRNSFRQDLRNSVIGSNQMSLDKFTAEATEKYRHSSQARTSVQGYIVHNVILRRFCIEHQDLLGVDTQELEDSESSIGSDDIEPLPPAKRQRVLKGRIAEGEDFWSQVDAWFKDAMKARGDNFSSEAWRSYIEESIRLDNARYDSFVQARAQPRMPRTSTTARRMASRTHPPSSLPTEHWSSPGPSSSSSSSAASSMPGFLEGLLQPSQPGAL
ncbi:hypothetical protein BJ912DRAFT_935109 [Pholiota molesta]|nr:hypothetical protein BJ912DRAFT_935109 [Pholiota molesta]